MPAASLAHMEPEPEDAAATAAPGNAYFKGPILAHPVDGSPDAVRRLRANLACVLSLDDAEILRRMPVQVPRIHNGCPNCRKGASKRDQNWDYEQPQCFSRYARHLGDGKVYDPARPDEYRCPACSEVFPDNPKFPQVAVGDLLPFCCNPLHLW